MSNPQVYGPDGVLRTEVIFSTSVESRFVTGTIPADAADVQVSINGSGFTSDPAEIQWGDGAWTVPNPESEPNGLTLLNGDNTVEVRAILNNGSVTPSTTATIRLVSDADLGVTASPPTNISVEQNINNVTVKAEPLVTANFRGMNFYASTATGGGALGYTRINVDIVDTGESVEEVEQFAALKTDALVPTDAEGDPVADPLYYRLQGSQEDEDEQTLQSDFSQRYEVPETARRIRTSTTLESVRTTTLYAFTHDRAAGPTSTPATVGVGEFAALKTEEALFYVATAVYYDSVNQIEYESTFSEEVSAHPTQVNTALESIPSVGRQEIIQQYITSVFRSNPQVKVEAGSVLRDTVIDPFSSESERVRFLVDFFNRMRTPALLLQIDDPDLTGTSVPVSQSAYKQALAVALYLDSATEVQNLIDAGFEAAASNYGKTRLSGVSATGEVFFYTTRRPSQSLPIPLGTIVSGGGVQFTTTRAASIDLASLASFYDPVSGRYGVSVPVQAVASGASGNLSVGQIRTAVSSLPGALQVTNTSRTAGGDEEESNLDLTVRVQNALASVDTGTERGYLQVAADVAGVTQAQVVAAGNPLMQRDLYEGVHRGGKVDVWVQGTNLATVTDTFAFTFDIAQDVQFELIGSPVDYTFRAVDPELSEANPIVEMLDNSAAGYEFRNATTGEIFDLTGVTITSYDTIQLSTSVVQPAVDLTDVVTGSYRRRVGDQFVLPRQPVTAISTVVGTVSGTLPSSSVTLVRPNAPLEDGRSTLAGDYLQVTATNDVPSGDLITVTDETHVLVGQYAEFLDNLGANFLTLKVYNEDRTVEYKGPNDPSGDPDYTVNLGTQTTALSIVRVESGDIPSGATVSIDYQHDENFVVTYTTNLIVSQTQDALNEMKHATADVLAKDAVPLPLEIEATAIFVKGRDKSRVDATVRTNMVNFFNNRRLGEPVRQSDVIAIIENSDGISYVVTPLSKMVPAENSQVVREALSTDEASESTYLQSLSTNTSLVYLLNEEFDFATTDGGGPDGEFKGVFQDDVALTLLAGTASLDGLGTQTGAAYIIGSEGRSIDGYSDDATLTAQGYVTDSARAARRTEITANRVLVSLAVGDSPTSHEYAVTYIVGTDSSAKNVDPGDAQYVALSSLLLTLDEDQ